MRFMLEINLPYILVDGRRFRGDVRRIEDPRKTQSALSHIVQIGLWHERVCHICDSGWNCEKR
jgi:hypothetical protein